MRATVLWDVGEQSKVYSIEHGNGCFARQETTRCSRRAGERENWGERGIKGGKWGLPEHVASAQHPDSRCTVDKKKKKGKRKKKTESRIVEGRYSIKNRETRTVVL